MVDGDICNCMCVCVNMGVYVPSFIIFFSILCLSHFYYMEKQVTFSNKNMVGYLFVYPAMNLYELQN